MKSSIMSFDDIIKGNLFSTSLFTERSNHCTQSDLEVTPFRKDLEAVFCKFFDDANPNERETIDNLVIPVLRLLGWDDIIQEQNLKSEEQSEFPDGLIFLNEELKRAAQNLPNQWERFKFGVAILETKKWDMKIDQDFSSKNESETPSKQMMRYIRHVEDKTYGKLRWGILTNGAKWRLYYAGAIGITDNFFELDLANILMLEDYKNKKHELSEIQIEHWIKVFHTVFSKNSFIPRPVDDKTVLEALLLEGQYYQKRVGDEISDKVFNHVFPILVRSIASSSPETDLGEVRDAALIVLYRLLFILYAEDRELLPVHSEKYKDLGLRHNLRNRIRNSSSLVNDNSKIYSRYWLEIRLLFDLLDKGDESTGFPQYNGGLFDGEAHSLLEEIKINDYTIVEIVDALSFEKTDNGREYVSYRNLSIQQLGAIYERLLEYRVSRVKGKIVVQPNTFSRKNTGSYYTSEDLVELVIKETIKPLIEEKKNEYIEKIESLRKNTKNVNDELAYLKEIDLASSILNLKICDPAMGSGHFLVCLVDYLTEEVYDAIALVEEYTSERWSEYKSPIAIEIDSIKSRYEQLAVDNKWIFESVRQDDSKILSRIILKRCIYGVDKNPMAVELAKVSLWLHTFTAGAPLSFIDHNLKCGDSLFGLWMSTAQSKSNKFGSPLIWADQFQRLYGATGHLQDLESIPDSVASEVQDSIRTYEKSESLVAPLNSMMDFIQALDWVDLSDKKKLSVIQGFFDGRFGDHLEIAHRKEQPKNGSRDTKLFEKVLAEIDALVEQERFFHWQVKFPNIWSNWEQDELVGGFDAIVGNPPWDRTKLEQVEWFSERKPEIAMATKASDRKKQIDALTESKDPLAKEYQTAVAHSALWRELVRKSGEYPYLSSGDLNLYSLFVERAMQLIKPDGRMGLLVPSGIAHDKTAAKFFRQVSTNGHVRSFFDFENGKRTKGKQRFFPDVHNSFKFCVLVLSNRTSEKPTQCAFFLHDVAELDNPESRIELEVNDFNTFNPNTGTMPIFRSKRDAELARKIYDNAVTLVTHTEKEEIKTWPVRFSRMFDMTNNSGLFRTEAELYEKEKAYYLDHNNFQSATGDWLPLFIGRMINHYDHRASSVYMNPKNLKNPRLSEVATVEQKADPNFLPEHLYWVSERHITSANSSDWFLAFRAIARVTDIRTMIATAIPRSAVGNTAQLLLWEGKKSEISDCALLLANMNSIIYDFTARQKVQSTSLNWYIVEQLPVIEREVFKEVKFGSKSAEEIVKEAVLELTYTSHNMASFAKDLGYITEDGQVKPPFTWDEKRRLHLKAKLDAIFFHLYDVTEFDDVKHIYSTFPIVQKEHKKNFQDAELYLKLCVNYINALAAGNPDAKINL